MRTIKILTVIFLFIILPSSVIAGNSYYVDCSATIDGDGSYSSPYASLNAVNSARKKFAVGDDLYFKVNTTCTLESDFDRIKVSWSGKDNTDRVIIGAYYGDGQFGLNGHSRPKISGNNNSYPGAYQGAIEVEDQSYVTVKDLRLEYIGAAGVKSKAIQVNNSNNINVNNCYTFRTDHGGIEYARVNTGVISDNTVEEAGYPLWQGVGAAIEVTAAKIQGATTNILVTRNRVFNSKHEGIGLYKNVTNCIVEYNVVYDVRSYFIYNGASKNNIYRYNLVYETEENVHSSFTYKRSSYAFASDIEETRPDEHFNGENE